MSAAIKRATLPRRIAAVRRIQASGAAQGDPGLLSAIGGALKGAVTGFATGGLGGAAIGAVAGGVRGAFEDDDPAPTRTISAAPRTFQAPTPVPAPGFAAPVPRLPAPTLPGAGAIPAPTATAAMPAGTNGRLPVQPGGKFAVTPAGTVFPCPAGTRSNKSAYFLKSGAFIAPGTRCVKIRRRNPLNPKALDRAISRLTSAKKASEKIKRISIRKKKC